MRVLAVCALTFISLSLVGCSTAPTVQTSPTSPSPVAKDIVNGFDAEAVYTLCLEAGKKQYADSPIVSVVPYNSGFVTPEDQGVRVIVGWNSARVTGGNIFSCRIGGTASSPIVQSVSAKDL